MIRKKINGQVKRSKWAQIWSVIHVWRIHWIYEHITVVSTTFQTHTKTYNTSALREDQPVKAVVCVCVCVPAAGVLCLSVSQDVSLPLIIVLAHTVTSSSIQRASGKKKKKVLKCNKTTSDQWRYKYENNTRISRKVHQCSVIQIQNKLSHKRISSSSLLCALIHSLCYEMLNLVSSQRFNCLEEMSL